MILLQESAMCSCCAGQRRQQTHKQSPSLIPLSFHGETTSKQRQSRAVPRPLRLIKCPETRRARQWPKDGETETQRRQRDREIGIQRAAGTETIGERQGMETPGGAERERGNRTNTEKETETDRDRSSGEILVQDV